VLDAQSQLFPLDHQLENKLGLTLYSIEHPKHTSIHPFELRDLAPGRNIDSLIGGDKFKHSSDDSWIERKLFYEHLLDIESEDHRIYGDIHADLQLGREFHDGQNTFVNTRGFVVGGSVSDNFSFYTEFFENQAIFPKYLESYIKRDSIVPGQGYQRSFVANTFDYSYSTSIISYRPSKYISFQAGHGKNFIGDGYRSLLLSDVAFNYPYFKITADVWKIKYIVLWTEFQHIEKRQLGDRFPFSKKSGIFHYLDVNITERFSIGLFEGIIWLPKDSTNNRGFEWNYLNPIIFLRPVELSLGSPDNILLGINTKYIINENAILYGQIMLDELTVDEYFKNKGYWGNKYGVQFGIKSFNAFNIPNLFLQGEINLVSPYTYSHKSPLKNYTHYRQSLSHPLGANFYEYIAIGEYSMNRFEFRLQLNYSTFGTDSSLKYSFGQNLAKSYDARYRNYGNFIGQGIKNTLLYSDFRISYLLNPLNNLRVEASYIFRLLETGNKNSETSWFSLGFRTSFRNLYYDF